MLQYDVDVSFQYIILDSGSTQTMDLHFNLDLNMQRVQMEGDIEGVGPANAILDIKEVKATLELSRKHSKKIRPMYAG